MRHTPFIFLSTQRGRRLTQSPSAPTAAAAETTPKLARQLGLFDSTMLVMGGIVGAGLFINPYVVAERVHSPVLILAAWAAGGIVAMLGAFIYAELADRMPDTGGEYAYLRHCYHPLVGFLFGWVTLLVVMTGGMAAVAVTFARYFLALTGLGVSERIVVVLTLAILTLINCLGAKLGSRVQSLLMVMKIAVIAGVIVCGLLFIPRPFPLTHPILPPPAERPAPLGLLAAFGSAMIPVLFAYGGWQTSNYIATEIRDPRRNLTRALVLGVAAVILLYLAMNAVCVRALGAEGLAQTKVPATAVMQLALGNTGARLVALGIALSTLGFLSQSILTGPRVYFAMARDGLFFAGVARVNRRTHAPVAAIILQSVWTAVIALSGSYEQILNYVVSTNFIFFGLSASCIFILRRDEARSTAPAAHPPGFRAPGHPFTTLLFIAACWLVVLDTLYKYPANSLAGFAILLVGLPVYAAWRYARMHAVRKS
jgi:APA family basic amino acid/polyamine antiporter